VKIPNSELMFIVKPALNNFMLELKFGLDFSSHVAAVCILICIRSQHVDWLELNHANVRNRKHAQQGMTFILTEAEQEWHMYTGLCVHNLHTILLASLALTFFYCICK
jgi:hypothetical protein